jgi:NAD(P)-dependent dehydrogenase (short-subunit alcohol dehydrogenase family)
MTKRLEGKTAIVVGAGCIGPGWGNGSAAAATFARHGARVMCVDANESSAADTADRIRQEGGQALHACADIADLQQVERVVAATLQAYGGVDILHNNVGIAERGGPVEATSDGWDRVFAVNVKGALHCAKAVLPHMIARGGGSIINISSIAAVGWTGHSMISYQASKAALNQFTRMVAVQHAPDNVRCNCIMPGLIDSPRIYTSILSVFDGDVDKMRASRANAVPMRRMGEVWDIANAALFLASDEAKYITGSVLAVDGGMTCALPS